LLRTYQILHFKSHSYLSGASTRSAREERPKQIAQIPKMSAFLKPADRRTAADDYRVRVESSFHQRRGGGGYGNWHWTE